MLNPEKQSLVGGLITGGLVAVGLGVIVAFFLSIILGLVIAFGGIATAITGLLIGQRIASGKPQSSAWNEIPDCQIIARFCLNPQGDMMFDLDPDTTQEIRYFVQLAFHGGSRGEFRCAPEVYFQCGEGMRGEADLQGDWLGRFRPFSKDQEPPDPIL